MGKRFQTKQRFNLAEFIRTAFKQGVPRKPKHQDNFALRRIAQFAHIKKREPKRMGFKRFWRTFKGVPSQSRQERRRAAKAMWRIMAKQQRSRPTG